MPADRNEALRHGLNVRRLGARLHAACRGQGTTEYVIILVGISVVCIAIALQFGGKLIDLFTTADSEVGTLSAP